MTAPIPTIQVLLDDGSGTYPTDITGRVSLAAGVSVSGHGRTDEFSTAGAAQFSCTLRNDDGGLSNALGFGLGPFGVTPFGGLGVPVYPGQGIRYKETKGATTVNVFTGQISSLDLGWTGGTGKAANVTLTAVDPLAALGRRAALRSMLEQEILLDRPTAYYTLGEVEGSTSAGDTSGNAQAPLALAGTGTAPLFGANNGPGTDGLTAPQFYGAKFLTANANGGTWFSLATGFSFECFMSTTATVAGYADLLVVDDGTPAGLPTARLGLAPGGVAFLGANSYMVTGATALNDGKIHHLAVTATAAGAVTAYVDGASIGTVSSGAGTRPGVRLAIGSYPDGSDLYTGAVSHAALFTSVLSPARIAAHATFGFGIPSETSTARFSRFASYVGAPVATTGMSGQVMAAQATSGTAPLDALQAVADAEGGVLFCRGDGTLVLQGRGYRATKTTPTLTVPLKDISPSTSLTTDTQQVLNNVTVTRTGGATQLVTNSGSVASYGLYSESLDLAVADDASALAAAQWLVASHASPVTRMGSVTVNLLTSSQAEQIMAAEVGDRWALSGLPSQTWTGFGDLIVEGWSRTLTVSESGAEWSMSLNLLPWSLFTTLVLDDPTYGALDLFPLGY